MPGARRNRRLVPPAGDHRHVPPRSAEPTMPPCESRPALRRAPWRPGSLPLFCRRVRQALPRPTRTATAFPTRFERYRSRTSPTSKDTDRDGLSDAREDPDGDRLTNRDEYLSETHPQKVDSDGDGLTDDLEDPDRDGLWNWSEPRAVVHPRKADTDGDRLSDAKEDRDRDGLSNLNEQNRGTHPNKVDTDGDGFTDRGEVLAGTDPRDPASHPSTDTGGAPTLPGAPGCPVFPAIERLEPADRRRVRGAANSATMIATIGLDRGLHMDFGSYAGLRHPVPGRDRPPRRGSTVTFDYDDESDQVGYPIPASAADRGRLGRATSSWSTATPAACTSCSHAADVGRWLAAGSGRDLGPALERAAARRLDERRRRRAADPAGPRPLRRGRRRRDRARAAVHDQPHAARATSTRPATTRASSHRAVAAADGPARPAQGVVRHVRPVAAGPGHRRGAQALRDDPRRQRLALVHHRRRAIRASTTTSCTSWTSITGRDLEVVDTSGLVNGP